MRSFFNGVFPALTLIGALTNAQGAETRSIERRIFELAPGVSAQEVARDHGISIDHVFEATIHGFAGTLPQGSFSALDSDPRILHSEVDQPLRITDIIGSEGFANWGLDRIDQRSLPLDGLYRPDGDGEGVTAYIIDTGIRLDHQEFEGRARAGWDARGGNGWDCDGHGTHIAGIVGGRTFGVAKRVKLVSVAVMPCRGGGSLSDLIAGIDWVAANHVSPAVANLSIVVENSSMLDQAVRKMIQSGVPIAVAAGNNSMNACEISPGRIPEAMNVGASDIYDRSASISNYGPCVSWFAPGVNIVSAGIRRPTATLAMTGTSMAAPHTAGVAALYLQKHPSATPEEVKAALSRNLTRGAIRSFRSSPDDLLYCPNAPK